MNIPINDKSLLQKAFTHKSYLNESEALESNERLEFLGDAVLELIVSEHIFKIFKDKPEGELTALRSALVKTTTLAEVSLDLNFGDMLLISKGEEGTGGRKNQSLLADTFEAVVGAIYIDSGYDAASNFIHEHLISVWLDKIIDNSLYKDFKTTLQEKVQAEGKGTPSYKLIRQEGPDHQKIFTLGVIVDNKQLGIGVGSNKQEAEQNAAKQALSKLDSKGSV